MQQRGILSAMTATLKHPERFHETSGGYDRIDRDAGVIRGVRVLGLVSKNGRKYLREAVQKAKNLYEGARVYLDHKFQGDRSTKERWGKLVNVREAEDGGLVADLEYLTKHSQTEAILEAAEKFKDIGLSHDTLGRSRMESGERVIYEIVKVNSVDLVENPATTENLWESQMSSKKKKFLAVMRENRAKVPAADRFLNRLAEMGTAEPAMMKEMGLDDMEVEMEEEEAPLEGDEAVKVALRQAMLAIMDGPDDSQTTMKKIKLLMDAGDKVSGAAEKPAEVASPATPEEGMEESLKVLKAAGLDNLFESLSKSITEKVEKRLSAFDAQVAKLAESETELACKSLLESHGREVTSERLRLLAGVGVGDRDALVESWPKIQQRPGQSRPRYPAGGGDRAPVTSYTEARKSVRALQKK